MDPVKKETMCPHLTSWAMGSRAINFMMSQLDINYKFAELLNMSPYRAIGIMSGTSGDGIDAILIELDNVHTPNRPRVLASAHLPFSASIADEMVHARSLSISRLTELSFSLPLLYAEAAQLLPNWQTADVCGVHGQTVTHQVQAPPPAPRGTWQIGSSAVMAQALQMPVVGDLRAMDVALGGQGAPVVPFAHWFFLASGGQNCVVVNLGGICNASIVTKHLADVTGFDVGPGMMISDAFAKLCTNGDLTCDLDGQISRGGRRIDALHKKMLDHPFVARTTPKSAGREEFGVEYYKPLLAQFSQTHNRADVMHTLLSATADILGQTVAPYLKAHKMARVVLTGGGARNPNLEALIAQVFAPLPVQVELDGVMAPQNHEPAAMALIASRTLHQLPSALSRVTGAEYGAVLGHVCRPTPPAMRLFVPGAPQERHVTRQRLAAACEKALADLTATGMATAASVYVLHKTDVIFSATQGHAQRYTWQGPDAAVAACEPPVQADASSLFDLASLSKVVGTTAAIMALVSDGRLCLHARAAIFLPQLAGPDKAAITVDQLLRHRSGLAPWLPLYLHADNLDDVVQLIAGVPLQAPPGEQRIYSDLGYILLGAIVSAITQAPLDAYVASRIAAPLGLSNLCYRPDAAKQARSVATSHGNAYERRMIDDPNFSYHFAGKGLGLGAKFPKWRQNTLRGEVNDGNAHYALGGVAGHAGLFGTARDVACVAAQMTSAMADGQSFAENRLFDPAVVQQFLRPEHQAHYLGWANPQLWPSLSGCAAQLTQMGGVAAEGFTGGLIVCLPASQITAVLLSNRQHQTHATDAAPPKLDVLRAPWVEALAAYAIACGT